MSVSCTMACVKVSDIESGVHLIDSLEACHVVLVVCTSFEEFRALLLVEKKNRKKLRGMAEIWPLFQVIIENSNERWGKICHHSSHYCWTSHQVRRILLGQHIWKVASYVYIVLRLALI